MKVQIRGIRDAGVVDQERLVLKVTDDADIGNHAVFATDLTTEGQVSNQVKNAYWFPDKKVRAGDLVVLYSKSGTALEKKNKNGSTSHFFYWDLNKVVWNEETVAAVVAEIKAWSSEVVKSQSA